MEGNTLSLDTKGYCLSCLKKASNQPGSELEDVSIQNTFDCLDLDISKVFSDVLPSLGPGSGSSVSAIQWDLEGKLCFKCEQVLGKIRKVKLKMEKLEKKFEGHLNTFHGTLMGSAKEKGFKKEMLANPNTVFHLGIVEQLRKEVLSKCRALANGGIVQRSVETSGSGPAPHHPPSEGHSTPVASPPLSLVKEEVLDSEDSSHPIVNSAVADEPPVVLHAPQIVNEAATSSRRKRNKKVRNANRKRKRNDSVEVKHSNLTRARAKSPGVTSEVEMEPQSTPVVSSNEDDIVSEPEPEGQAETAEQLRMKSCYVKLFRCDSRRAFRGICTSFPVKKELFSCSQCDKVYVHKKNLKLHVDSVHKKKRHECPMLCGATFTQKSSIKNHLAMWCHEMKKEKQRKG